MVEVFDDSILDFFQSLHNPVLDQFLYVLTLLGEAGAIWIVFALVMLAMKKYRKYGIMLLVALILGFTIGNGALKNLVQRPRPCFRFPERLHILKKPWDYSFPSGHTLASMEAMVVLCATKVKKIWIPAMVIGVFMMGSRMYFYVHYPTDILAGMILGAVNALLAIKLYNILEMRKQHETV